MTSTLTAWAADQVRAHVPFDEVLASLPVSYARTAADHAAGSVAVVAGAPGWPDAAAAALETGARAVVVVEPSLDDATELVGRDQLVYLDRRWASNPVVAEAAALLAAAWPSAARLECRTTVAVGTEPESGLLDQLGLLRALVGPVDAVRLLTVSKHGYAAEASVGGLPVDLALTCTDALPEAARIRLLTTDGGVELDLPDPATARPALLRRTDPTGCTLSPTRWESGHRAIWRRVHAAVTSDPAQNNDLAGFRADVASVRNAFGA